MSENLPVISSKKSLPEDLPVLPLKGVVAFPSTLIPLSIGLERSIRLIDDVMNGNRLLFLLTQKDELVEKPTQEQLYPVGTVAVVHQLTKNSDKSLRVVVQGLERARLIKLNDEGVYLKAHIEMLPEKIAQGIEVEGLRQAMLDALRRLTLFSGNFGSDVVDVVESVSDTKQLVYVIASTLSLGVKTQQEILETDSIEEKISRLLTWIQHEIAIRELGKKIATETKERLTKEQKEYFLREQVRSIKKELGEEEDTSELGILRKKLKQAKLSEEAEKEAERELKRLENVPAASPEHGIILTYLDWLASLPWAKLTGGQIDVVKARKILDEDHYDLEKIKDRIIEYLSVKKLRQERKVKDITREPLLCFVGPPGVGKTSLGQSIARALNRKFARVSLGGMRDEAEIRGHRRTYISALPGRIIQEIKRADARDLVFMLDEIDKVGSDWRGDPSSALLEVLDPAQNFNFVDLYLGVGFDLSQVLFIATANTLDTIPSPLLDRMEVIQLPGYTDNEKLHIAEKYLIPKEKKAHGLSETEVTFQSDAILSIIRNYTREAGVRNLDRNIATLCRKVAKRVAEGDKNSVLITAEKVRDFLGAVRFFNEVAERTVRPGVATGLAWTQAGGEILFVEATMMPSHDERLILTGMLGDVMKESAQTALSYIRSHLTSMKIDRKKIEKKTIHIHIPEGAIPKDGPSAGVCLLTALVSLFTHRLVRSDVAMTGEITLRGKVLPVGGIKEKILAAHRSGIKVVILPYHNKENLMEDIPAELRNELKFVFAKTVEDVLANALEPMGSKRIKPKKVAPALNKKK
ncbi:MAG: endopeptidase La [Gammaproteobacteria bacterium]|nr:endopeptidase La [Gammaproteobacteria bacterium]